ncbi:UDP-xylose and UDP-N-acetylglucosamine transporter [Parasteatoda tepidariorum]|nr:UDP-xylose and UDP-N-acetylglucosamine transporter [Parasteatoda tepidariorum]
MSILLVGSAILSCCSNVVFLEVFIRDVPGSGNLITFFQFLFIACEGFIFTTNFGRVKPVVPLKNYLVLVIMFFATSVLNNWALNFDISMPLHMIFKSGSLVTSMLLGMLILKKRYTFSKYVSVLMVSVGIFIATWASQSINNKMQNTKRENMFSENQSLIGISLLTLALLISAGLGIYQERIFKKYGKHPKEALFYSHALPLPGFLLFKDIYSLLPSLSKSEVIYIIPPIGLPKLWLCLLGNVITQYICVRTVFTIAARFSSLDVTMIITCRKFISLLFSIFYFQNPFTALHWFGTFLVFAGSLLFADVINLRRKEKIN